MNRRKRAEQTPKRSAGLIILEVILILCAAVYIYPVFLMFTNSFKSFKEVLVNVVALPTHLEFANYTHVIEKINYGRLFFNNVVITFTGILGIVFFPHWPPIFWPGGTQGLREPPICSVSYRCWCRSRPS